MGVRGVDEYGHASAHPESTPGGVLPSFSSLLKKVAAISALRAAAVRRLRSETRLRAQAGGKILSSPSKKRPSPADI